MALGKVRAKLAIVQGRSGLRLALASCPWLRTSVTNGISRNLLWKAVVPLVLLSVGASRCPFGGAFGFALSLIGYAICLIFALSLGEFQGTTAGRIARIVLAAIGCLIQWAGTVAAATAVAGIYFARTHSTAYTAQIEIVMAVICAVIAPALLTFKGRSWMGWNDRTLAQIWGYWLAFYPLTAIATALGQPWGSTA